MQAYSYGRGKLVFKWLEVSLNAFNAVMNCILYVTEVRKVVYKLPDKFLEYLNMKDCESVVIKSVLAFIVVLF